MGSDVVTQPLSPPFRVIVTTTGTCKDAPAPRPVSAPAPVSGEWPGSCGSQLSFLPCSPRWGLTSPRQTGGLAHQPRAQLAPLAVSPSAPLSPLIPPGRWAGTELAESGCPGICDHLSFTGLGCVTTPGEEGQDVTSGGS